MKALLAAGGAVASLGRRALAKYRQTERKIVYIESRPELGVESLEAFDQALQRIRLDGRMDQSDATAFSIRHSRSDWLFAARVRIILTVRTLRTRPP